MSLSHSKKSAEPPRRRVPIEIEIILHWIKLLWESMPEVERIEFRVFGKNVKGLNRSFEKNAEGCFELVKPE
jgi:hypothetical protein